MFSVGCQCACSKCVLSYSEFILCLFANELTHKYIWWCSLQINWCYLFASTPTGPKWEVKSKWKSTCNTYKIWHVINNTVMFWGWPLKQLQPWNIIFELLNDIEGSKPLKKIRAFSLKVLQFYPLTHKPTRTSLRPKRKLFSSWT